MSCSKFRYKHCKLYDRGRKEKNADHLYRLLLHYCGDGTYLAKQLKPKKYLVDGKYMKKLKKVAEEAWTRYEKNPGKEISMALEKLQFAFPILKDFLAMGRPFDDEMEQELESYLRQLKADQKWMRVRNKRWKAWKEKDKRGTYIYVLFPLL